MRRHTTSLMMLLAAIAFYVIVGRIMPDMMYADPATASSGMEHASAGVGQLMRTIAPFFAAIFAVYAAVKFLQELKGSD